MQESVNSRHLIPMRAVASLCVSYCRIVFCQLECLSRARVGSPSCVCLFFLKYVQGLFFLKYVPVETLLSARPLLAMVSQDMMFALVLCTLVAQLLAPLGDVIINLEIKRQLCLMAAFGLLVIIGFVLATGASLSLNTGTATVISTSDNNSTQRSITTDTSTCHRGHRGVSCGRWQNSSHDGWVSRCKAT